jgi:drug/metabolite transporter superfamily protein YnfA
MFIPSHFDCFVLWCSLSDNMQVVFVETGTLVNTVFTVIHVVFQPLYLNLATH